MDALLPLVVVALAACRGPLAGSTGVDAAAEITGGQDGGAAAPSDAAPGGQVCPSVLWTSPRTLALVMTADGEVTFVRADGSRQVVYRATGEVPWFSVSAGEAMVVVAGSRISPDETHFEAAALDHDGNVRWEYRTAVPEARQLSYILVDARGAAAFGLRGRLETTVAVLADGTIDEIPGVSPLAVPDEAGWFPVTRVATDPRHPPFTGFIQVGMTQPRPLVRTRKWWPWPSARDDGSRARLVYVAEDAAGLTLVDETPAGARQYPLPAAGSDRQLSVDRSGRWLLVSQGDVPAPRWLFDLDAEELHALPALGTPLPMPGPGRARVASAGHWFLGHDGIHPLWRLNASTQQLLAVDPTPPAPLATFDEARFCALAPALLEDGRLAMGLRGPSVGGLFLGHPGGSAWTRVGPTFSGVDAIGGRRTGATWVVHAESHENRYCPAPTQWTAPAPDAPGPLAGPGVYLVPPAPAPMLALPPGAWLQSLHPSGLCAQIDGRIVDLPTGQVTTLPTGASIDWL